MIQAIRPTPTHLGAYKTIATPMLVAQKYSTASPNRSLSEQAAPKSFQVYAQWGRSLFSTFWPARKKTTMLHPNVLKPKAEASPQTPTENPDASKTKPLRLLRPHHKLMSYNAENFVMTNRGKLIKSPNSIQALSDAILLEGPEVIALQEVGDKSLLEKFNRNYLHNLYPNIVSIATANPADIKVAMMSKANIRVVDSKSHLKEMSQGAGYDGKRDFLEATFETDTGFRFTVYNAHCRSMRGGEAKTAPIRMQEVGNAAKILKAHIAKNPQAPIFVTGDFNTNHDTPHGKPVIELITHLGKPQEEPEFTEVMLKDGKADPTHNGYNNHPNNKLDYIFTSKSMLPQIRKAYVAGDFQQNPWKQASDHLPYITEFEELPVPAKKPLEANNQGNKAEKGAPFTAEDKDQQIQSNIVPAPRTPKLNREPKRRKLHLNA